MELESILKSTDSNYILNDSSSSNRQILKSCALFIEYRSVDSSQEIGDFLANIQKFSTVISKVDAPSMHILRCKGTVYQPDFERSIFIYELPSVPPRDLESQGKRWTLAQAIADKSTAKPSDVRVRFAVGIATAVMFTHAVGLVHKSICPENILSFVVTVFLKMSRNPDIFSI